MTTALTLLSTPVISDRKWSTGRVPNASGGFNYIAQGYNYPDSTPSEWLTLKLETGAYTIDFDNPYKAGDRGRYCAGPNYVIANQVRDPNGLLWFPAVNTWIWYYDPSDERVHDLGPTVPSPYDTSLYNIRLNVDGSLLLGGTIAAAQVANGNDYRPQFITVNTATKVITNYGRVGATDRTQNGYAYVVHSDGAGSDWAYVLVGQEKWDCVAVNLTTGAKVTLGSTAAGTSSWANFEEHPEGLTARLYTNYNQPGQTLDQFWVVDGVKYTYTAGYDPATLPFTHRSVTPYSNPVANPPQLDESRWPSFIGWRPFGSTGDYTYVPFTLNYTAPITLESLTALPDGTLLGSAQQYQGFFRYHPSTTQLEYFGSAANLISEGNARLVVGNTCYFSGYPNGKLYAYDITKPWTQTTGSSSTANPAYLGAYSNGLTFSGVKRAEVLVWNSGNSRVYMVGLRDRSGTGMGVGYYDTVTKAFGGTYTNNDLYTDDTGLAVFGGLSKVVIGGKISTGDAQLVVYDLDLNEIERQTPHAGWTDTGQLFRTSESSIVVGLSSYDKRVYRWDIVSKTLLNSIDLSSYGAIGTCTQKTDGNLLVVIGTHLYTINTLTLAVTDQGVIDLHVAKMAQLSTGDYFAIYSTGLYALSLSSSGGSSGSGGTGGGGSGSGGSMSTDVPTSTLTTQQLMALGHHRRELADALDQEFGDLLSRASTLEAEVTPSNVSVTNAEASPIVVCQPVYTSSNGSVNLAKADALSTSVLLGLVAEDSIPAGLTGVVRVTDYLDATTAQWDAVCGTSGGLTGGVTYYLSDTTAGMLTSTPPSATEGHTSVAVIRAVTATRAKIVLAQPIVL